MKKKWKKLISLIFAFAMVFATNITVFAVTTNTVVNPLDTGKEILYYLFWTEDSKLKTDVDNLQQELSLTDNQIESLKQLGLKEHNSCKELKETYSSNTPSDINLFNLELEKNIVTNNQMIQEILGNKTEDFRNWMNEWWENERQYRTGSSTTSFSDINGISKIWATQYESNTSGSLNVSKLMTLIHGMKMIIPGILIDINLKI